MNYDITFCEGENCSRKEECHRFCELLRFRADKDPDKKTYISMIRLTNSSQCTMFWSEKGDCPSPELTDKLKEK